jgi:hypothetical protein
MEAWIERTLRDTPPMEFTERPNLCVRDFWVVGIIKLLEYVLYGVNPRIQYSTRGDIHTRSIVAAATWPRQYVGALWITILF